MIEGTVGIWNASDKELRVYGNEAALKKVKDQLTAENKTVLFQMNRIGKQISKAKKKFEEAENINDLDGTEHWTSKIEQLRNEYNDLKKDLYKEYWADTEDNGLSIPLGFWGVCEKIEGDLHLNNEISYFESPVVEGKIPRYYQIEAIQEALKYKRASVVCPTGSGKSMMLTLLANSFVKAGKRVCIIEPTIELVSQTKKFVEKYIPNTGGLGGKFKFKLGNDVLVTTINSATKYIDMYDCIIVDEFQHSAADTYTDAGLLAVKAEYFYGFTACPIRADGLTIGIHASCGPVVYEKDTYWGIANGFLSPAKVCMVEVKGLPRYPDAVMAQRVYSAYTHSPVVCEAVYSLLTKALDNGKKVLVLYKTVQAGLALREYCKSKGLEFDVASSEFRNPLERFKAKEINFLVANSGLMAEGVDVPGIDCVITCVQNSSENMTRQIMGRGLRLAENKKHLVLFDVYTPGYKQFMAAAIIRKRIYKTTKSEMKEIIL